MEQHKCKAHQTYTFGPCQCQQAWGVFIISGQFCLLSFSLMVGAARKVVIHCLFFSPAALVAEVDTGAMRSWGLF